MAWKQFNYPSRGLGDCVSVNKSGDITIGKVLADKLRLGQYVCVRLDHDDEEPMMKLKFLAERQPKTAPIRRDPTFTILARAFVRHLKISPGQYDAEWDEKEMALTCIYHVADTRAA
jgi:hypothetical protein